MTGEYNLLIYNHHDPIQKSMYRDDYGLCMKAKKKPFSQDESTEEYSSGHYHSEDFDDDDNYTGKHSDDSDYEERTSGDHLRGSSGSSKEGNSPEQWQAHGGS